AGPDSGLVAPFGGAARFMGTNPWSIGVPAAGAPLIFDAATSTAAEGKVRVALARGGEVPAGPVRDAGGRPTLRPADAYDGGRLHLLGGEPGGPQGYGLSVAARPVRGRGNDRQARPNAARQGRLPGEVGKGPAGVFVIGIDPAAFG